jgi:putative transposase
MISLLWSQPACWLVAGASSCAYDILQNMDDIYKTYLHNPPHYFVPNAMYMVTGSILYKQHLLREEMKKEFFLRTLFERANQLGWELEAWAVLHNHYHFIAQAPEDATTLAKFVRQIHSITAIEINRRDKTPGRQVWHNYWDTCLTYEKSYLARLHYVHTNPVRHGLVEDAMDYPYCSYRWFINQGDDHLKGQVFAQPIDKINVFDDF